MNDDRQALIDSQKADPQYVTRMIDMAQRVARKASQRYNLPHMDTDDFTQECLLGWLQGRNMGLAAVDAFRRNAPLKLKSYHSGVAMPHFVAIAAAEDLVGDVEPEYQLMAAQILNMAYDIPDPRAKFTVFAYYMFDKTLDEIGKLLGVSRTRVFFLREAGVSHIREQLGIEGAPQNDL